LLLLSLTVDHSLSGHMDIYIYIYIYAHNQHPLSFHTIIIIIIIIIIRNNCFLAKFSWMSSMKTTRFAYPWH
jgi:hypothetical protein